MPERLVRGAVMLSGGLATALATALVIAGCGGQASPPTAGTPTTSAPSLLPVPTSATASVTTAAATTAPVGTAQCTAATLRLGLRVAGVAAGSTYQDLVFTNSGNAPCVLAGFPTVSFVTAANGRQVGATAMHSGAAGAQVTLAPGQAGYATVQVANSGNYDPATCQPTAVSGFRVVVPNDSTAMYTPAGAGTTACANTHLATPQLFVRTVTSAPAG